VSIRLQRFDQPAGCFPWVNIGEGQRLNLSSRVLCDKCPCRVSESATLGVEASLQSLPSLPSMPSLPTVALSLSPSGCFSGLPAQSTNPTRCHTAKVSHCSVINCALD
jgi:hypothetical protein